MIESGTTTSQQSFDKGVHKHTLTQAGVRPLLAEQGYELVERFQHIHASRGKQEWHVCLVADLPLLNSEQFLQQLQEAVNFRIVSS